MAQSSGQLIFDIVAQNAKFVEGMNRTASLFGRSIGKIESRAKQFSNNLKGILIGAVAGVSLKSAFSSILQSNVEYGKLSGALETVTGSAARASQEFDRLQDFAASTPFSLDQSVQAFIRLKTLGLDPSEEAMRSYGNTASAFGKDMMQFIEAVADAATGEFERLKEFGIRAKQNQDTVEFTFQGITTTVKKNADAITEYLQNIGDNNFAGAMARQMDKLPGKLSNLEDNFNKLKIAIGQGGFTAAVGDAATELSGFIQDFIDSGKAAEIGRILGGAIQTVTDAFIKLTEWTATATTKLDNFFAGTANEIMAWWYGVDPQAVANIAEREKSGQVTITGPAVVADVSKMESGTKKVAENSEKIKRDWSMLEDIGKRINKALEEKKKYLQGEVDALRQSMMTAREIHNLRLYELREAFEFGIIETEAEFRRLSQRVQDEFNGIVDASYRSAQQMESNFSTIFLDAMHGKFDNFFQKIIAGFDQIFADLLARNFFNAIEPFFMGGGVGSFGRFLFGGVRASGGPVLAGHSYLVGERGPEMFVPEVSGRIEPNGGGRSIAFNGNIIVQGDGGRDPRKTGAQISRELIAQLQIAQMRGDI